MIQSDSHSICQTVVSDFIMFAVVMEHQGVQHSEVKQVEICLLLLVWFNRFSNVFAICLVIEAHL